MKNLRSFLNRLYADYLMPSRMAEYEALLVKAKAAGYRQLSVRAFHRMLRRQEGGTCQATSKGPDRVPDKVLVHRHDIDSDVRTARKMFALEVKHGVSASYYFRLSTLDIGFMRDIEAAGGEASYHYEEVAAFAKRHRLRRGDEVRARFPEIRDLFAKNFITVRNQAGLPMTTVASHGDFANRRLQVINHELLRDPELRSRCGIECEAYDAELLRHFDVYISDRPHPMYYYPVSPFEALGQHRHICLLTHPVQWETNWLENTRCNMVRLAEEVVWHT